MISACDDGRCGRSFCVRFKHHTFDSYASTLWANRQRCLSVRDFNGMRVIHRILLYIEFFVMLIVNRSNESYPRRVLLPRFTAPCYGPGDV